MNAVAIVGAGPAGLAAARFLAKEGFEPVLFEQGDCLGGQWSGDARYSGVWPSMRTNTSRVMTCLSDLRHEPHTPVYPANKPCALTFGATRSNSTSIPACG
jgi:dimethylaniline monooxygenase (N-oxide forming)